MPLCLISEIIHTRYLIFNGETEFNIILPKVNNFDIK